MKMFCLRCKVHKEIENPQPVTFKNGRRALKATCKDCHAGMMQIQKPISHDSN